MPLVLEYYWDLPLSNLLTVDQFSFEEDKSTEFIMKRKKNRLYSFIIRYWSEWFEISRVARYVCLSVLQISLFTFVARETI